MGPWTAIVLTLAKILSICGNMALQRQVKWFFILVVLANIVILAIAFLGDTAKPAKPMPNPNGFDDFVRAGNMMQDNPIHYSDRLNQQQLAALVAANAEALTLARVGLSRGCRVPDIYVVTNNFISAFFPLSRIGGSLMAEAKLAEFSTNTNQAIKSYLDLARFVQKCTSGGTYFFRATFVDYQSTAMEHLELLVRNLDPKTCREIAQQFEMINLEEDTVEDL